MKIHAEKVDVRSIAELVPYARNSRTHSTAQIKQIEKSIQEFGWTVPVLVDEAGTIIAGHGRVMAASNLGIDAVPVVVAAGWTDDQKRAYIIADNKIASNAEWDKELLALELSDLKSADYDLGITGFNAKELVQYVAVSKDGLTDEDEVPEPLPVPVSAPSDVWLLGAHRLMCGSATVNEDVARLIGEQKADMVFTDPPYGMKLNADYSGAKSNLKMLNEKGLKGGKKYDNVIGDHDDFVPELISTIFSSFPNCKEVFLWGADYYAELLPNKNDGSWIVWDKRLDESADKMYGSAFELCWSLAKHKREIARVKWAGVFGTEKEHDKKRVHPTQKPTALVEWFFSKWGKSGDIVADLFGGSGSTLIACEKTGRACRMMELDPKYVDVIIKRWQAFTGKQAVLESDGKTFDEIANARH